MATAAPPKPKRPPPVNPFSAESKKSPDMISSVNLNVFSTFTHA